MVLKWLGGGKPDHPLADEKGARELLASLTDSDAPQAIEDVRHWVESVMGTEGFKLERRAELLLLLDEAAQAHQRKLARDYLSNPRLSKFQEAQLRRTLSGLWADLANAGTTCIDQLNTDSGAAGRMKAQLPLFCVRVVRALAAQLKWHYMHYEPGQAAVWQAIGKIYRFAETKKILREAVVVYPNVPLKSSTEREFMSALMLAASAPTCLRPLDIELAERVVAHCNASFLISDAYQPKATYNWIDLASGLPPKRLMDVPTAAPSLRYFAAGPANAQLDNMIRVLEGGAVPSDLNLGGTYEPARVLGVVQHLRMYWAETPPVRKHDRYEVKHQLNVVNGIERILARLQGATADAPTETWVTDNISAGGMGVVVSSAQSDWLGIGKLIGLSVAGGSGGCSVGMVRRCYRPTQQQASVGIRTFAKAAYAVTLQGREDKEALLLSDGTALNEEVLICMREGEFDKRESQSLAFDGHNYLLIPVDINATGDDFEIGRYRVMQQA